MRAFPKKTDPTRAARQAPPPARQPAQQPAPPAPELALHRALGNQAYGQLLQAKLTVNRPGDRYEQEADRMADQVVRMSEPGGEKGEAAAPPVAPPVAPPHAQRACAEEEASVQRKPLVSQIAPLLQRQDASSPDASSKTQEEEYAEAATKTAEAFLETETGKKIKDEAVALATTLPGLIIVGGAAAGIVAKAAAKNEELLIQPPEIPLDKVGLPGIKMHLTWEGPFRTPTKAMIGFSGTFGARGNETSKPSAAEQQWIENARRAEEQRQFRESMKTPEQRAAEQAAMTRFIVDQVQDPTSLLYVPGLKPANEAAPLVPEKEEREGELQRKATSAAPATVPSPVHEVLRTPGCPLDASTRGFMEPRFGYDFSRVHVHTDAEAASSAQAVRARAYTVGRDVVFGADQYRPQTQTGRRLLAHELTHVIQQGANASLATGTHGGQFAAQRQEEPDTDGRLDALIDKVRRGEELTEEELAYVKEQMGREIVQQLLGGAGQIRIDYDSSRAPQDVSRRYRGRLELRMSGFVEAVAGSLEGVAEADIDLVATVADQQAVLTIAPPTESNRMAAMIRERLFPNGEARSFDVEFRSEYFPYVNAVSLISPITVALVGPDTEASGGMIVIRHESVPNGIELIMTLSPSGRSTSVEETERDVPSDHWLLTPNPRLFSTIGYGGLGGTHSFVGTIGADFPLAYSTDNPLAYAGLGLRGSLGTNRVGRLGAAAFLGLNVDPLTLQLGLGVGAAFLPEGISTPEGPAQTVVYEEAEGIAAYRVVSNLELMLLLTVGGGKGLPAYGTAQLGAAYRF